MNRALVIVGLLLLTCGCASLAKVHPPIITVREDAVVRRPFTLMIATAGAVPHTEGAGDPLPRIQKMVRSYRHDFRIRRPEDELRVERTTANVLLGKEYRDLALEQVLGRYPLFGTHLTATVASNGRVEAVDWRTVPTPRIDTTRTAILREQAIQIALGVKLPLPLPKDAGEPSCRLGIVHPEMFPSVPNPRLAWQVSWADRTIYVDATTRAVAAVVSRQDDGFRARVESADGAVGITESANDCSAPPQSAPVPRLSATSSEWRRTVYFATNASALDDSARHDIAALAAIAAGSAMDSIIIAGGCDERGSKTFNLELGRHRATAAATALQEGRLSSPALLVTSFGEGNPVAMGHDENAWHFNRRAEITLKCAVATPADSVPEPPAQPVDRKECQVLGHLRAVDDLLRRFDWDSYDRQGGTWFAIYDDPLEGRCPNAYYTGNGRMRLCSGFENSREVIAHECGHGVFWYGSQVTAAPTFRALNESFGDFFAHCLSLDHDWVEGNDCELGMRMGPRDLALGRSAGHDVRMVSQLIDEPHANGGLPNRVLYLLCTDGALAGVPGANIGESRILRAYLNTISQGRIDGNIGWDAWAGGLMGWLVKVGLTDQEWTAASRILSDAGFRIPKSLEGPTMLASR